MTKILTDSEFSQVIAGSKPVLVDFWAEWCGPCRQLTPIIEELSKEMGDTVEICKMNIDENPDAPTKLGVRSIPTLVLFKDGKPLAVKVGALPKATLREWIESELS
jgi:thioredoxin 1